MGNVQTALKRAFPRPAHMSLSILESTGQFKNEFPTVTLSYLGMPHNAVPDDMVISDIHAFGMNFEPKGKEAVFELHAFLHPKKELLDFADCLYIGSTVDTLPTNKILQRVEDLGRYAVIINTDFYLYRALVDDSTGEVLESTMEYRYTN